MMTKKTKRVVKCSVLCPSLGAVLVTTLLKVSQIYPHESLSDKKGWLENHLRQFPLIESIKSRITTPPNPVATPLFR